MKIENIFGDGIGYVELLDTLGDQWQPAEDARTSTGKGRLGPEKDKQLQERLMRDGHTSPFEGVVVKFEVCAPLFVIRELDRHRTLDKLSEQDPFDAVSPEEGMRKWFARNEMSGRYIQMPDLYYHPAVIRGQSTTNKQGGGADMVSISPEVAREFVDRGMKLTKDARALYSWAVEQGIEKGMARVYNTQNQYTKIRYTGSAKNIFDMLSLRLPKHVLWECRMVAEAVLKVMETKFPEMVLSWRELVYDGVKLTAREKKALRDFFDEADLKLDEMAQFHDEAYAALKKIGVI